MVIGSNDLEKIVTQELRKTARKVAKINKDYMNIPVLDAMNLLEMTSHHNKVLKMSISDMETKK